MGCNPASCSVHNAVAMDCGEPPVALGYVRQSEGVKVSVDQLKERIAMFAEKHSFLLYRPIYVDTCFDSPLERPALRALLDVVWELHIPRMIVPSLWHLSQVAEEAAAVRQRLIAYDCELILIRN